MKEKKTSNILLKRLAMYLNYLKTLPEDTANISATTIAKALDLGDVLVRKDLARASNSGRRKIGHVRELLIQDIEHFLNYGDTTNAIVIGSGRLGQALLEYRGFATAGIRLIAGFDIQSESNCSEKGNRVYPIGQVESFCRSNDIEIGIITVPKEAAQEVCDILVSCGIRAIWNFAPVHLKVPEWVVVKNENLAVSLVALRAELKSGSEPD